MVRIYLPYVSSVLESLAELRRIADNDERTDFLYKFYAAKQALDEFLKGSIWGANLRVCHNPGEALLRRIAGVLDDRSEPNSLSFFTVFQLHDAIDKFRVVLEAEFQTSAVYLVTARRGYDISILLEQAEVIFPDELIHKIPDVKFDLQEAGRCIAFSIGTAAGFHLLRALETVICKYWHKVMNGAPLPENRNLGAYIREMEQAQKGDGKVLTALRQIKDFHRNSLMHPEETLDLDQAIALLGIVQSAIVAMLPTIDNPPLTLEPLPLP